MFLFGLPLAVLILLRANFGMVFLATCAGLVLIGNIDGAAVTAAGSLIPGEGEAYVKLAVTALTILSAGLIFRDMVAGRGIALHCGIMLLLSAMLWLILPAESGMSWLLDTTDTELWRLLSNFKTLIITAGFGLSLLAIANRQGKPKRKKRR